MLLEYRFIVELDFEHGNLTVSTKNDYSTFDGLSDEQLATFDSALSRLQQLHVKSFRPKYVKNDYIAYGIDHTQYSFNEQLCLSGNCIDPECHVCDDYFVR